MIYAIPVNQITRIANAIIFAAAVTFGLLMLMNYLIDHDLGEPEALPPPVTVDFVYKEKVIETEIKDPPKREEPKPQPVIELPRPTEGPVDKRVFFHEVVTKVEPTTSLNNLDLGGGPMKLVAVAPTYPSGALARGLEGHVDVQFDIDTTGLTTNIRILDSTSSLFHRAVINAVERWKYRPKMEDGKPVPVYNLVERVTFELEN